VSVIFLLATGFLYAAVAVYAVGYTQRHEELYARRFYAGLNLFAWSMLAAPLMSSLALLWIAVEVTTVISRCWSRSRTPTAPPRLPGSTC